MTRATRRRAPATGFRCVSLPSGDAPLRMGVFAICPVANKGCSARFHHVALGGKCDSVHKADHPRDGGARSRARQQWQCFRPLG
jgi:hypothetical protein